LGGVAMQGPWQTSEKGDGQLRELNSMIRRQESYFGSTFALFMIANAVLVFSYYQQEDHFLARSAISLVALADARNPSASGPKSAWMRLRFAATVFNASVHEVRSRRPSTRCMG